MSVVRASLKDLDWIVSLLDQRRQPLVARAPVFWRPASDAATAHRTFIEHEMTDGGARVYRTQESVLIAAPRNAGWLVDDVYVPHPAWADGDGRLLWNALASECAGAHVRFVCPTYENDRGQFAQEVGLHVTESWWLFELPDHGGGQAGWVVDVPGADALTVAAPPIYAPPGPILFLATLDDASIAVPSAIEQARKSGCAAVVVNHTTGDQHLAGVLAAHGFRRHCDYYEGAIHPI